MLLQQWWACLLLSAYFTILCVSLYIDEDFIQGKTQELQPKERVAAEFTYQGCFLQNLSIVKFFCREEVYGRLTRFSPLVRPRRPLLPWRLRRWCPNLHTPLITVFPICLRLNLWPVCLELCDFEEFSTAHCLDDALLLIAWIRYLDSKVISTSTIICLRSGSNGASTFEPRDLLSTCLQWRAVQSEHLYSKFCKLNILSGYFWILQRLIYLQVFRIACLQRLAIWV